MHFAAKYNAIASAKWLLDNNLDSTLGADGFLGYHFKKNLTPILIAIYYGHNSLATFLLEESLKSKTEYKMIVKSLLYSAFTLNAYIDSNLIASFLKKGVLIDVQPETNETPLHPAVRNHSLKIIKLLLENSQTDTIHAKNNNGESILFAACSRKSDKIVRFLAPQFTKSDFQEKNKEGLTLLCVAVQHSSLQVATYLLNEQKLAVHVDGAIHPFSFLQKVEMLALLLEKGADINAKVKEEFTLLEWSFLRKDHTFAHFLLQKKATQLSVDIFHHIVKEWAKPQPLFSTSYLKRYTQEAQDQVKQMLHLLVTTGFNFATLSSAGKKASELDVTTAPWLKKLLITAEQGQWVVTHHNAVPPSPLQWLAKTWNKPTTRSDNNSQKSALPSDSDNNSASPRP